MDFNMADEQYEYLVMPYGLTNALVVFQVLVNDVLCDFLNRLIFFYFDDILIFSTDLTSHQSHARVLQRLPQNQLFVMAEKSNFTPHLSPSLDLLF